MRKLLIQGKLEVKKKRQTLLEYFIASTIRDIFQKKQYQNFMKKRLSYINVYNHINLKKDSFLKL